MSFELADAPWRAIYSTLGVARPVIFGRLKPRPLSLDFIDTLIFLCDSSGLLLGSDVLQVGDKAQLQTGPFAEFMTKLETIRADQRVWILLGIVGRATKVSVLMDNLQIYAQDSLKPVHDGYQLFWD